MADKFLSEAEWKKFAKGRDLKDALLIKALAAFDKAKKPDEQIEALADIEKQLDGLRKFVKGDKDIGAYLDNVEKSMNKEEKIAKSAAKESEATEEDEESSVLLTTKMIPLLRQIKKGEEMQAMLANTGKEVAVLLSRRSISPSKRKLLTDYLEASGTPKFALGHCIFEENAYTFVLQTQAGGLAKKLKAALFKQTDLRLKVRVRGEDPSDIDDDGEPAEDEVPEAEGEETTSGTTQQGSIPVPPPPPVDPLKAQFETRMAALEPRVLAALKAQSGDAGKIRAVAEFVRGKGEEGNYKAALQGLESLAKLLEASAGIPPAPPLTPQTPPANTPTAQPDAEAAAFNARLAALMPEIKTAITADAEVGQDIKLKVSEAGVFARKKEFDRANALLDEAETLMAQLKERGESGGSDEGGEGGEAQDQEQAESGGASEATAGLRTRLAKNLERLAALADPKVEAALARVLENINSALEAGDAGAALPQLARLEEVLEAAERRNSAASPIARNLVKYRTAHAEWLNAERVAVGTLRAFGQQVLAHPDIAGSDNFAEVKQYVETLPTLVPTFGAELGEMLKSIEEAETDPARIAAVALSQDKLRSYQEDVLGDELLIELEQFAAQRLSGLEVLAQLRTALGRLEAAISV